MGEKDATEVLEMIKDLHSGTESYHRRDSIPLRYSVYSGTILDDSNTSMVLPKKRKLDDTNTSLIQEKSDRVPTSPWEWRRLKAEVISLRTRLSHQEAMVQQLHQIRKQIEQVFNKEKSIAEMQIEEEKQTVRQLEARLDVARRTNQEAKEAQTYAETELSKVRSNLEQRIGLLMDENAKLLEEHRQAKNHEENDTSQVTDIPDAQLKLEGTEKRISQLEESLKESREAQKNFELQSIEVQNLKMKIEELESQKALWEEGKQMVVRAAKANDLEKELAIAKTNIASLRESVKGKLLLEEQMCSMKKRVEHIEKLEQQVAKLEAKQSELVHILSEYESIGIQGGPLALRRELNRLQHAEALLLAEEGLLRSKGESVQREYDIILKNYEEVKKSLADTAIVKDRLLKIATRLQRKLTLVTRERDSYRQQLDLYEKEMTVDSNSAIMERIPSLERAIEEYREMVTQLEMDLEAADGTAQRNECKKLRQEIEKLQGELQHRALKGDFNCNARILHLTMNPTAVAEHQAEQKQKALLMEIQELRSKVATGSGEDKATTSNHLQEMTELKQSNEIKMTRLKEAFKVSSQEYRQACYQLLGWRIDRTKEGCYKLSSQYAESQDDFLFFHVGEAVDLLETSFSSTLGSLIEQYLQQQHSVPMFLNAVQADLFTQQTLNNILD